MIRVILFLFLLIPSLSHAEVVERIVAVINSEIITLSELNEFKSKLKKGGLVDDTLLKSADVKKIKTDRKEMLNFLINEKIVDSEIKKQNLQVTIEKVEQEIRSIAKKNGIDRSRLKKALTAQGVDFSQYQEFIKTTLERQSLVEKEVSSKIKISDEEITEYFMKKSGATLGEEFYEYTISHIYFLSRNGGKEKAKERAQRVIAELKVGKSFESLASQFSEDPNFTEGGLLGSFKGTEMNSQLNGAIRPLRVGQHSKIIELSNGNYQIVKLSKKKVIPNPKLNAQKGKISAILFEEAFKKQLDNWLNQRRQEAFIRINI